MSYPKKTPIKEAILLWQSTDDYEVDRICYRAEKLVREAMRGGQALTAEEFAWLAHVFAAVEKLETRTASEMVEVFKALNKKAPLKAKGRAAYPGETLFPQRKSMFFDFLSTLE